MWLNRRIGREGFDLPRKLTEFEFVSHKRARETTAIKQKLWELSFRKRATEAK